MLVVHQFPCGGTVRAPREVAGPSCHLVRAWRKRKNWFPQSGFQETGRLRGKMRIAQSKPLLARSREKEVFLQRAECGQSTQIITVAECRSDLFGISLFIMQPHQPPRLLRKREKFGEEDATPKTRVQQMFLPPLTNFPDHRPKPTETSLLRLS